MKINLRVRDEFLGRDIDIIFGVKGQSLLGGRHIYVEDPQSGQTYCMLDNEEFVRAVKAAWELVKPEQK